MAFGDLARQRVERALRASEQTAVWMGIQSTQGAQAKEGGEDEDPPTLAMVAAVHEYGSAVAHVPQRSYLRSTADAAGKGWLRVFRRAIRAYADGDLAEYRRLLSSVGSVAVKQIARKIRARIAPPLAAATVARRRQGPRKTTDVPVPLIDTSQLIGSLRAQAATPQGPMVIG